MFLSQSEFRREFSGGGSYDLYNPQLRYHNRWGEELSQSAGMTLLQLVGRTLSQLVGRTYDIAMGRRYLEYWRRSGDETYVIS